MRAGDIPRPSFLRRILNINRNQQNVSTPQRDASFSPASEDSRVKKDSSYEELLSRSDIDLDKIRDKAWSGIPDKYRAKVWRLFLDYEPVKRDLSVITLDHKRNDYFDCLERVYGESQRHLWTNSHKNMHQQILKDLPRTKTPLLRNEKIQNIFERILFVWSVRHPASGYVQGMNDLLQPFLYAFLYPYCNKENPDDISSLENVDFLSDTVLNEVEADCFWCFSKLLEGLQDLYIKKQPGIHKMLDSLDCIIKRVSPRLAAHIEEENIQYQEFAFRWMNCLLVREFSVPMLFRLWDYYLCKHSKISTNHVFVCAAMMNNMTDKLLPLNHADFIICLQNINPDEWSLNDIEEILAMAYCYEKMFSSSPSHLRSNSVPNFRDIRR